MILAQGQSRKYDPVGRCIYCGATKGLTTEHIVPIALGGNATLPKASCEDCASKTKRFEQTCTRFMFGAYRIKVGFPTRHPEQRPSYLPLSIETRRGSKDKIRIPASEHPSGILLVKFPPPGILSGKPPPELGETVHYEGWLHIPDPSTIRVNLSRSDVMEFIAANFDELAFAQLLAKVALSYSVAESKKLLPMDSLLPRLIRGETDEFRHFIGGNPEDMPSLPGVIHRLSLKHEHEPFDGCTHYVANVQLFAYLGAPQYKIVIAESRFGGLRKDNQ